MKAPEAAGASTFRSVSCYSGRLLAYFLQIWRPGAFGDEPPVRPKSNASGNCGTGILVAGDGASVKSTTANGNGGWGIWAQPISSNNNVTFNSLTASHNGFTGIEIDGNAASLKSSTAFGNGDLGIDIDGEAEGAKVKRQQGKRKRLRHPRPKRPRHQRCLRDHAPRRQEHRPRKRRSR